MIQGQLLSLENGGEAIVLGYIQNSASACKVLNRDIATELAERPFT